MPIPEGFSYSCVEDYVLDRGEVPVSEALTEEQFDYLTKVANRCGVKFWSKQCFHNAQSLILEDWDRRMKYVEGIACSGGLPVHHAWVELDGKLVDLTRSTRGQEAVDDFLAGRQPQADLKDRVLGEIPEGWEYIGVKFDHEVILEYVCEFGETNAMIASYKRKYPLMRGERIGPAPEYIDLRSFSP